MAVPHWQRWYMIAGVTDTGNLSNCENIFLVQQYRSQIFLPYQFCLQQFVAYVVSTVKEPKFNNTFLW